MTTIPAFAASLLRTSARAYAVAAVARLRLERPELLEAGLPETFAMPNDDVEVRLQQLAAAVEFDRPELFVHAVGWYTIAFHHRGVPADYLPASLRAAEGVLSQELPHAAAGVALRHLRAGIAHCAAAPVELPSVLDVAMPYGRLAAAFLLELLEGRGEVALGLLRGALADGASVADLQDRVLVPVQREVGRMWLQAEIPIADEHYASSFVERALWILHERLPQPAADAPRVVTMGVGGNLHDLGMRLVGQRLQSAGYQVHHLGPNLPAGDLEWAFADRRVDLVAISATMALHLHALAGTIDVLRRVTRGRVPILVGGEPFGLVRDLHLLVGADASAADAEGAVAAARQLLGR